MLLPNGENWENESDSNSAEAIAWVRSMFVNAASTDIPASDKVARGKDISKTRIHGQMWYCCIMTETLIIKTKVLYTLTVDYIITEIE